jgi:hypothetical protein
MAAANSQSKPDVASPFDFLLHLKPESVVILYTSSNERARLTLKRGEGTSTWVYSLEPVSTDKISKELPVLATSTTYDEYKKKRLVECRHSGQATVTMFFVVYEWRSRMRAVNRTDQFKKGTKLSDKLFSVQYPPRIMTDDTLRV